MIYTVVSTILQFVYYMSAFARGKMNTERVSADNIIFYNPGKTCP